MSNIQLSRKLTNLLLLTYDQRGQTLHFLDIRNMCTSATIFFFFFRIEDTLKTSRPGDHFSVVIFDAYTPDSHSCVFTMIVDYLERTKVMRGLITWLLITTKPSIRLASQDTLRYWTKDMGTAGIDLSILPPIPLGVLQLTKLSLTFLCLPLFPLGWPASPPLPNFTRSVSQPVVNLCVQFRHNCKFAYWSVPTYALAYGFLFIFVCDIFVLCLWSLDWWLWFVTWQGLCFVM